MACFFSVNVIAGPNSEGGVAAASTDTVLDLDEGEIEEEEEDGVTPVILKDSISGVEEVDVGCSLCIALRMRDI